MTNRTPLPKSDRRRGLESALLFLGLGELIGEIFASPMDRERNAVSTALAETEVVEWQRWVTSDDDKVCEFCDWAANSGLYSVGYEMLSHPNCRCHWEAVLPGEE